MKKFIFILIFSALLIGMNPVDFERLEDDFLAGELTGLFLRTDSDDELKISDIEEEAQQEPLEVVVESEDEERLRQAAALSRLEQRNVQKQLLKAEELELKKLRQEEEARFTPKAKRSKSVEATTPKLKKKNGSPRKKPARSQSAKEEKFIPESPFQFQPQS